MTLDVYGHAVKGHGERTAVAFAGIAEAGSRVARLIAQAVPEPPPAPARFRQHLVGLRPSPLRCAIGLELGRLTRSPQGEW